MYKRYIIAIGRLNSFFRIAPEHVHYGTETIKDFKGNVDFKNITFGYTKNKTILKNISFSVKAGETIAFVGESGVGKTTLVDLLAGYCKLTSGEILFDGIPINKLELKWMRNQIAHVPQDLSVFNDTILNNLSYANKKATFSEIKKASVAAYAHGFIMQFPKKYKQIVGERGIKLSAGQKQRVAIAMAFLKNPKILILDEPTAALDAESEINVTKGMHELIKRRTTFIIAHRLSTVREADKIIVLDKKKIAEVGTHKELLKKQGLYSKLYNMQMGLR